MEGSYLKLVAKSKDEYTKLDGNRTGDGRHVYAGDAMDIIFHTESGIWNRMCGSVSRQH